MSPINTDIILPPSNTQETVDGHYKNTENAILLSWRFMLKQYSPLANLIGLLLTDHVFSFVSAHGTQGVQYELLNALRVPYRGGGTPVSPPQNLQVSVSCVRYIHSTWL